MDVFSVINNLNQSQNVYDNPSANTGAAHNKIEEKPQKDIDELKNHESREKVKKELEKVTAELNKAMDPFSSDIKFKFDSKADELTVKVVDKNTDKVVKEFPPKEALKLMEKVRELVGILFDKRG